MSAEISVIVPVYNAEKHLSGCIDSILNQTFKNFELILIDDSSSDNCGCICDDFQKKDERISVIHHEEHRGCAAAKNSGLDAATGNFVVFINRDDYVSPMYLETLHSLFTGENVDITCCNFVRVFGDEPGSISDGVDRINPGTYNSDEYWKQSYENNFFYNVVWNKMYRRHLFQDIRFRENVANEDVWIMGDLINNSNKIVVCNEVLYYYRIYSESVKSCESNESFLSDARGYLTRAESFADRKGWYNCAETMTFCIHEMIKLPDNMKEEFAYKELRSKTAKLYKKSFFHLSHNQKTSTGLFLVNENLYRSFYD